MPSKPETTLLQAIGRRVAKARRDAELTQEEMAEQLGVAVATWSRWERGHVALSLERLHEVSQILDVGLGDLLDVERPPPHSDKERVLLREFRGMDEAGRQLTLAIIRDVRGAHPKRRGRRKSTKRRRS